jgi:hypothetical protein
MPSTSLTSAKGLLPDASLINVVKKFWVFTPRWALSAAFALLRALVSCSSVSATSHTLKRNEPTR